MSDRLSRVESSIRELRQSIGTLENRLADIERAVAATGVGGADTELSTPPGHPTPPAPPDLPAHLALPRDDLVTMLSFIGRTFVALGGAYLLRALTDAAIVPLPHGIALGLAYAMGWLVMSDRAAAGREAACSIGATWPASSAMNPSRRGAPAAPIWTCSELHRSRINGCHMLD